ncbi:MAG: universal stress protein [Steroidobacter sp.]
MNPIRTVLAIVDPTAQQHPAVSKAALLAQKFEARLDLFVCDTKAARDIRHAAHISSGANSPFMVDMRELLDNLARPLRERGLDVMTDTTPADPLHVALVESVKHKGAELFVKDTHHHTLAQRTFLTNTDWELIRRCPVPLLLTKAKPWGAQPCICAAVDPGHVDDKPAMLDHHILDLASTLARRLSGDLHVLHAYIPAALVAAAASASAAMVVDVSPVMLAAEREYKMKQLLALVSDHQVPPANVHAKIGGTCEQLCLMAEQLDADVMTMGAISRSALKRILVGSTAELILERLPCDALIVKPPDFAELLPM